MADAPKIQIDSDWKAEAQKEKERLAKKEQGKSPAAAKPGLASASGAPDAQGSGATGEREPLPPADFHTLVGMLAQQAIMGLGVMADRKTGGLIVDLEGSRFSIDLLEVLEQKSKGNLSEDEASELKQILGDLRARFVQVATIVSQQMARTAAGGVEAAPANAIPNAIPNAGPIITE